MTFFAEKLLTWRWRLIFSSKIWFNKKLLLAAFYQLTYKAKHCTTLKEVDIDPRRDNDASPMSSYSIMFRPTWMICGWLIKLFREKIHIFGFPWCSTREELSIDVSITKVGLILTKPGWFHFLGYGQTDRVLEISHGNMSTHKKFQLKTQN